MLALVKTRRTENENRVRITGKDAEKILAMLKRHFRVSVVEPPRPDDDELIDIEDTEWWRGIKDRILAGYRLKAGITQKELARRTGMTQSVVSEYERGKRAMTEKAAVRFAAALGIDPACLLV